MLATCIALLVVGGVVFKVMTAAERARVAQKALTAFRQVQYAIRIRPEEQEFRNVLTQRMRWPAVAIALVVLNTAIVLAMLFGSGTPSDPRTMIGWGASIGPRTTNGEWWRLATSMFVHSSVVQVLLVIGVLVQVGCLAEWLVGPFALAAVYLISGVFANLANLSADSGTVAFGASGAAFGLYGLLLAFLAWHRFHRSSVPIPLITVIRLAPLAVTFLISSAVDRHIGFSAELTGCAVGIMCGLCLMIGGDDPKPHIRRLAIVFTAALIVAMSSAIPLRGITDVWPELERIVAMEDRTLTDFQAASGKFRDRQMTAHALAGVIEQQIIPEFQTAQARLKTIRRVPNEQRPLMESADRYLRLRSESWHLRAEGVRKIGDLLPEADAEPTAAWRRRAEAQHRANLATLGSAEGKTHDSLIVLDEIRASLPD